jgi:hypothetical protein
MFRASQRPSSGVPKTVSATSGIGHGIGTVCSLQLCGQAHYHATRKSLENRMQLDEPVQCSSGGDQLLLYKILLLLFFPLVRILCALCLESKKKMINMVLMRDLWNFNFFDRGDVSPTNSGLCCFVSGS